MKIFKKQNGRERVYVQLKDIMYISNHTYDPVPESILRNIARSITFVGDWGDEYLSIAEKDAVEYLRSRDFIIDFDEYKDLNIEQIEEYYKDCVAEAAKLVEKNTSKKDLAMLYRYDSFQYKLNGIIDIYNWKTGKKGIVLPVELDDEVIRY